MTKTTRHRGLRLAGAALAAGLLLTGCTEPGLAPSGPGEAVVSNDGAVAVFPPEERGESISFAATDENGEAVSRSDFDDSVLVLNFWYAACPPCRVEAADLESVYQSVADDGVGFLGVNMYDQADTARAFAREFGVTYPSVLDVGDGAVQLSVASVVSLQSPPVTLVLDKQGRVAGRILGAITEPSILETMIRDTLAEDA